jgi:hypothetical protein
MVTARKRRTQTAGTNGNLIVAHIHILLGIVTATRDSPGKMFPIHSQKAKHRPAASSSLEAASTRGRSLSSTTGTISGSSRSPNCNASSVKDSAFSLAGKEYQPLKSAHVQLH